MSVFEFSKDRSFEIIVIDNNSSDGTVEMIKQKFPQVNLISLNKNTGFAYANNLGIKRAKGDYILLLNPDTQFKEDTLSVIAKKLESDNSIGILGCKLLNTDKSLQPSVRNFPTIASQLVILLKLHYIFPFLLNNYLNKHFDYSKEQEVDQVMGAFFCVKKEVFDTIGLLDENYFIWFEEVDFCYRAKKAGYKVLYTPKISVIHYGGQSFAQQMAFKKQWWFFKSALRYFKKRIANS